MHQVIHFWLSFGFLSALLSASQQPPSSTSATSTQPPGSSQGQMMPMPLVAPLFIEDRTLDSTITLVSNAPVVLEPKVILTSLSGGQLASKQITMRPHSQQVVRIQDLLVVRL